MALISRSDKAGWFFLIFHGLVLILVLNFSLPSLPKIPPGVFKKLLAGNDPLPPHGSEFSVFRPMLPYREKISFIMDYPFSPYGKTIQHFYTAQSYLVPYVLSHEPDQRAAIIFCSNQDIAEKRLKETGYRFLVTFGDGKGVAVKNQ